jgi:small-conductance mechanosensitive channel
MSSPALAVALRTTTPTEIPGTGPAELVDFWPFAVRAGWFLLGFLVVAVLGLYVLEPAISRVVSRRNRNNATIQEAISRYVRLFVAVVAVLVGAGIAGYVRLLTDSAIVIAAVTLAIGVAGQAVIGSLISGFVLVMDPEFNVGDYVEWADGEGTVRSITLRVTRIQTPNGELLTVPNTVLTGQTITNPYGRGRFRVVERVSVAYEDDVSEALRHLEAAATELDGAAEAPEPDVYVEDLGSDAVVVRVHYWIENPQRADIFDVRSAFARAAKTRLDGAGITISPASKRDLEGRIEVADTA